MTAGEIGRYGDQAEWATDQREDDGGSLVFITEPLAEPFHNGAVTYQVTFEDGLPSLIAEAVAARFPGPGALTGLQIVCQRLWEQALREAKPASASMPPRPSLTFTVML